MKRLFTLILIVTTVSCVCFAQSADDEKYEQAKRYYDAKENGKAIPILNELAQRNHAKALNLLGFCYEYGYGVAKNLKKSVECFQKSANLGLVDAQINLGYMYVKGLGVTQDYQKAYNLYQEAASKGDTDAFNNLGALYAKGLGVEKDLDKAIEYYTKAAEGGHTKAMINLAWKYKDDEYKEKHSEDFNYDYFDKQAEKWFRMAAKQGIAEGYYGLGCIYDSQLDGGDIDKAYELYKKAADMGYNVAQAEMAFICFCHGQIDNARLWFEKADKNGATDDSIVIRGYNYEFLKMIFYFFCNNKQYAYNGTIETYDYDIFIDGDNIYVGVNIVEKGTSGFLKLKKKGKTLSTTPGLYEYYYDQDNDIMRFKKVE